MTARVTLEYKGQRVTVEHTVKPIKGETPENLIELIRYMFEDGIFACDCNRAQLARKAGADWPDVDCAGKQIEVIEPIEFVN